MVGVVRFGGARSAILLLVVVAIAGAFIVRAQTFDRVAHMTGVIRAAAAPFPVVDAQGARWSPRMSSRGLRLSGGRVACFAGTVYGTASPDLYRCTLVGVRRLTVPVRSGTYGITLYFAEVLGARPGRRVFDVEAEGRPAAMTIDVAAQVGPREADHAVFSVPVNDGTLDLQFLARRGQPILSAVEITLLSGSVAAARASWTDEFRGARGAPSDPRKWGYDVGGGGWGNDELETYTRSRANAALDGRGHLAIVARSGSHTPGTSGDYTSARLTTREQFTFRYGAVQARIRVPGGRGLWPGFWALGTDLPQQGWPRCGEFDVMEVIGSKPFVVHGSVHGPAGGELPYSVTHKATASEPLDRSFHVYGVVWLPDAIQFELDGRPYGTVVRADLKAGEHWVFDKPFFLLLNLAVGGQLPGSPDASTRFPATMLVDWVRVTR
jgi:beta-glucanase (GH16 family)